jgi:predicted  nucleic acid-binding Zn-ribbon protein
MAETPKLSVEKVLKKLVRDEEAAQGPSRDKEVEALNQELKRMKAQRLRLERPSSKRD